MTTPTQRTCCICGEPGANYLVTWTINRSAPPTNIYAHRGECARIADKTYLNQPSPSANPPPPSIPSIPSIPPIQLTLAL